MILGLLNKQIAAELHTAEKTIKVHRGRVMQKLRVTSVPELVRISQRAGVAPAQSGIRLRSLANGGIGNHVDESVRLSA